MITITAKHEGFRRCGISFGRLPQQFENWHFTSDQLAMLKAEPQLDVVEDEKTMEQPQLADNPFVDDSRWQKIVAGCGKIDQGNPVLWTALGQPQLGALQDASGVEGITAAERNAAWLEFGNRQEGAK